MARRIAGQGPPEALLEKLRVLHETHTGAPRKVFLEMSALETDLEEAASRGEDTSKIESAMSRAAARARPGMAALRKTGRGIRSGLSGRPALVPCGGPRGVGDGEWPPVPAGRTRITGVSIIPSDLVRPASHDFVLKLDCLSDPVWGVGPVPSAIEEGVAGWSQTGTGLPTLSNMNGKGDLCGMLTLMWSGKVPWPGEYRMRPMISIDAVGECFADGHAAPGVDATAEAVLSTSVSLDENPCSYQEMVLASQESRLLPLVDYFDPVRIDLLASDIRFRAAKGQVVRILVSLTGETWTRGKADAEILVTRFGAVSNVYRDTEIPVEFTS